MRVLVLPLLACTALLTVQSGPTEKQIRESLLSASGLSSEQIVIGNGNRVATLDRAEVGLLRKLGCRTAPGINAYTCSFVVGAPGADRPQRRITARFLVGPGGATFARQVYANIAASGLDRIAGDEAAPTL